MKQIILALLLVLTPLTVFAGSGQILDANSDPVYIGTVYGAEDIPNIQFAQADNLMYLVDGNDIPQVLTRTSHTVWSIADVNFTTGPFLPENITSTTITPTGTSGSITLNSSTDIFESASGASHVDSIWAINQVRLSSTVTGDFTANGTSLSTPFFTGDYGFTTSGSWNGTVTLQRSTNNGISWRAALTPLVDTNFDNPAETEEDGAIYRVVMSDYSSNTCTYTITITDNTNKGVVRITAVADGNTATALVLTALVDTSATKTWREPYWSDVTGWPSTVAFHQQRLVYGGSRGYPQTIWFGKADPDNYENFLEGTLDTSAFTIALQGQNPIRWLKSQDYLMIGTSSSTGKYGEQGKAITPTSPNYQEQSKIGCAAIMATDAADSLLFIERGNRKVRELAFELRFEKYLANDLTILAEDIAEGIIKEIAFQMSPDPTLWCVLEDGDIATLTYNRNQKVIAWSKQITDGDFESVCRIPGLNYEDEIWVVVKRTIDGNDVRYVEKFEPRDWGSDPNDAWFVDSGLTYTGSPETDFNGLGHLIGEDLAIYADRLIEANEVVDANGEIILNNAARRVLVGLPFTSKLETMPLVIDPQDRATNKKVGTVSFDFLETGACEYSNGANGELMNINFKNSLILDPNAVAQGLYTSVASQKKVTWVFGTMKKQTIFISTDQPMPLTIRSITPNYRIYP